MKKKSKFRKILGWSLLAVVVAALAVLPGLARAKAAENSGEKLLSAVAETGELTGTLSGGGALEADDEIEITVPDTVEITEYLVSEGEHVTEGTPVAAVDKITVMAATVEVQKSLDALSADLTAAANDKATASVKAAAAGRIKALYVAVGDDVRETMLRYGSLGVISLDGLMSVEFTAAEAITVGESVRVTVNGKKTFDGTVESFLDGKAVVTLTDNGPALGDSAEICDKNGTVLGAGSLAVHCPYTLIAESGTVSAVNFRVEGNVNKNAVVLSLKNVEPSAEYENLASKRREYTELLTELFLLYQNGTVNAPADGYVIGLDDALVKELSAGNGDYRVTLLANEPMGTAASVTYNRVMMVASSVGGVNLAFQLSAGISVPDYADLSAVSVNTSTALTVPEPLTATAFVYVPGTGWQPYTNIQPGDVFVVAYGTGGAMWMVFVQNVQTAPGGSGGSTPGTGTGGAGTGTGTMPNFSGMNWSAMYSGRGSAGTGSTASEEEEELFDLEGTTVASLVPDLGMSVSFPVDELDVLRYSEGMTAEITVDALPGRVYTGTVTKIGTVGESSGGNSKYTVTVALDRTGEMLDGMNASVTVHTTTVSGVLVPVAALIDSGSETRVCIGLDRTGKKQETFATVKVGVSDGETAQILEGLEPGTTVWYTYYSSAAEPGMPSVPEGFTPPEMP